MSVQKFISFELIVILVNLNSTFDEEIYEWYFMFLMVAEVAAVAFKLEAATQNEPVDQLYAYFTQLILQVLIVVKYPTQLLPFFGNFYTLPALEKTFNLAFLELTVKMITVFSMLVLCIGKKFDKEKIVDKHVEEVVV